MSGIPAPDVFEVRLSRRTLLLLVAVGLLFLLVGLDLVFFHRVFGPDAGRANPLLFWAFNFFAIVIGGLIVANTAWYLIAPPIMLRISKDGVAFGTGLRYTPRVFPLASLESVEVVTGESSLEVMGKRRIVETGVALGFERRGDIPSALATSAGIGYYNYVLTLSKTYTNRSPQEIAEAVRRFMNTK